MDSKNIVNSKALTWVIAGVAGLALLGLVFRAGMVVGFNKANFNYRWGDQYRQMMGGPGGRAGRGPGMMGGEFRQFGKDDFFAGHNVIGEVVKITSSTVVVKGTDNIEKPLIISGYTSIVKGRNAIDLPNLKEKDWVAVIGSPSSSGVIEARLIRVLKR